MNTKKNYKDNLSIKYTIILPLLAGVFIFFVLPGFIATTAGFIYSIFYSSDIASKIIGGLFSFFGMCATGLGSYFIFFAVIGIWNNYYMEVSISIEGKVTIQGHMNVEKLYGKVPDNIIIKQIDRFRNRHNSHVDSFSRYLYYFQTSNVDKAYSVTDKAEIDQLISRLGGSRPDVFVMANVNKTVGIIFKKPLQMYLWSEKTLKMENETLDKLYVSVDDPTQLAGDLNNASLWSS